MKNLAVVFAQIEKSANQVEDVAKGMLAAIKHAKASTLEAFDVMVAEAYDKNGWNQAKGRPNLGNVLKPAPQSVKLYVSTVRAAYRLKLKVLSYTIMQDLRNDISKARTLAAASRPAVVPALAGVQVQQVNALTGALWHDAVVLWEHLPEEQQALFEKQVRSLLTRYTKQAPADLKIRAI